MPIIFPLSNSLANALTIKLTSMLAMDVGDDMY